MTSTAKILRLDASARNAGSATCSHANETIENIAQLSAVGLVTQGVADGLPFVDEGRATANFTSEDFRTNAGIEKFSAESRIREGAFLQDRLPRAGSAILET
jgi:hypothetical protein